MKSYLSPHTEPVNTFTTPIVTIIVDDHPISADGIRGYLETSPDILVADICYDGETALESVAQHHPDIVLVDLELEGSRINGIEVARRLHQRYPTLKLLVVSAHHDPQRVLGAVAAGINGYLVKTSDRLEIIQSIMTIMHGISIWDPKAQEIIQMYIGENMGDINTFARKHNYSSTENPLTEREWDVLELAAHDYSNRQIAEELVIAEGTVKSHFNNILAKLKLKDRGQARVWYFINRHLND